MKLEHFFIIGIATLIILIFPINNFSSVNIGIIDTNSFDQNTIVTQTIIASPLANVTMVDFPADRNELFGLSGTLQPNSRFQLDLNRVSQYRINVMMGSTTSATTRLLLQHSDGNTTFYDSNIGNQTDCCVLLAGGVGMRSSGWIDINQDAARAGTYFRLIGYGGNGINDVAIRKLDVQFKVPVATYSTASGGGSVTDTNCSNNSSCVITGRINSGFDANVLDINSLGDSNFVGNNASTPPTTINNNFSSGAGNPPMLRLMQGGITKFFFTSIGGIAPVISFENSLIGAIGYVDGSGFLSLGSTGFSSSFTDDTQFDLTAPTTNLTNTTLTNNGSLFVNNAALLQNGVSLFSVDANIDGNFYAKRIGDINRLSVNRLISNFIPDSNFLRSLGDSNNYFDNTFTRNISIDQNIYADTFDKNIGILLNNCYINSGRRDMQIYGNIITDLKTDNDAAFVQLQVGSSCGSLSTIEQVGVSVFGANPSAIIETYYYPFTFIVHDNNAYQITSTVAGSGSITLDNIRGYFP